MSTVLDFCIFSVLVILLYIISYFFVIGSVKLSLMEQNQNDWHFSSGIKWLKIVFICDDYPLVIG